jgi:hypothetical protein
MRLLKKTIVSGSITHPNGDVTETILEETRFLGIKIAYNYTVSTIYYSLGFTLIPNQTTENKL